MRRTRPELSDDGFGQANVLAVSDASDRHADPGFGRQLGISDGRILHAEVQVPGQSAQRRTALADGPVEGVTLRLDAPFAKQDADESELPTVEASAALFLEQSARLFLNSRTPPAWSSACCLVACLPSGMAPFF